jgi:hypothetical protein
VISRPTTSDPAVINAVHEAMRALVDLRIDQKFDALELIDYLIQVELVGHERGIDPTTH